ncbi:polyisoprenoid-binding protein [Polaribacter sp. ALD11]|uniref:YceI family protein n=1 Tax=Polaribacter sp. ALD11 TaxID=2058137 RepID=UPI000C30EABA|nr:YceI family protein [Polaribacter sp. ALD11]AUC86076.1 polyisoprenoid-binding protein [Polaribacter sp. ALD11]
MKKVILSLVLVASVLTACKSEKKEKVEAKEAVKIETVADLNNVDVASSVITWKGTKPTGAHNGTIMLKEGSLNLNEGKLTGGSFAVNMSTIKVLDIPADKEGNGKLVGHLSAPDFFDVAAYATSKFVITSVEETEGKLAVTGNLTIKDVTKSITIPAMLTKEGAITTFKSETFSIDRADFNVKYGSKKFFDNLKDKFIDDLIEMSFTVNTKA